MVDWCIVEMEDYQYDCQCQQFFVFEEYVEVGWFGFVFVMGKVLCYFVVNFVWIDGEDCNDGGDGGCNYEVDDVGYVEIECVDENGGE